MRCERLNMVEIVSMVCDDPEQFADDFHWNTREGRWQYAGEALHWGVMKADDIVRKSHQPPSRARITS